MLESFHQGGWGMYPTLILGCLLALSIPRASNTPTRRNVILSISLAVMVALSGLLGFLMGLMRTLQAATEETATSIVYAGTAESLNNLTLALVVLLAAALILAVGLWRRRDVAPAHAGLADRTIA